MMGYPIANHWNLYQIDYIYNMMTTDRNDTICALATPAGGAIGIIRISGNDAIEIADKVFRSNGKSLTEVCTHTVHYGNVTDDNGDIVDDVLLSVFRAPNSYTGENSVEISCHGSRYILRKVMESLLKAGCRQAAPGEYTYRAFMNGKMDLSQAEAVAELITSTNKATHKVAIGQLRGNLSNELSSLRGNLLHMTSLLELELDFSEQDVNFANRNELLELAEQISSRIESLMKSFETGRAIKDGIPVAIIGGTNVGKSTLLNCLLGEEKAIVSSIHGTTRDVIEDAIDIDGVSFRFIDTAGIRDTSDEIENLGIERTYRKIDEASIILWVIDSMPSKEDVSDFISRTAGKKLIIVRNKIDLGNVDKGADSVTDMPWNGNYSIMPDGSFNAQYIEISAKCRINIESLEKIIFESADIPELSENNVIITNARHYTALQRSHENIAAVICGIRQNLSVDLLCEDLRLCISHLGDIIGGTIATEETLQSIFKNFCVGK